MSSRIAPHSPPSVDPDEARSALDRILASRHFVNAHKKKAFLRLVCAFYLEGRASELNEYRIAFEVFDRDDSYSPAADPIVRVVAHDIRKKLELYYQSEGASDATRLELPAGSYQPVFRHVAVEEPDEPSPTPAIRTDAAADGEPASTPALAEPATSAVRPGWTAPLTIAVAAVAVALGVAVVMLASSKRDLEHRLEAAAPHATALDGPLWAPFARDGTPPLVILSNPPVLRLANATDPEAVTKDAIPLGPETVAAMKNRFVTNPEVLVREDGQPTGIGEGPSVPVVKLSREPRLVYSRSGYTGIGEAIGLHRLTDYFRAAGRTLVLKQSRTVSAEDLKNHNLVLLGGAWVNEWAGKLPLPQDFVFTTAGTVANRRPEVGEAAEYIPEFEGTSGSLVVDYGVITVGPNMTEANEEMVLSGVYSQGTEAAAEFVTEKTYVDQLNARLRQLAGESTDPLYFQALLRVEVENGIPTKITLVTLHRLSTSAR
jgi:hypothetical protein